jgi:G:T-mismatch repair DNA endonuclease (very short patch repair protein)
MPRHATRTSFVKGDLRLVGKRRSEDSVQKMREKLRKRVNKPCDYCGASLQITPYRFLHQRWHFCNSVCYRTWQKTAIGIFYKLPGFKKGVHHLGAISTWKKKSEKEKADWVRKMMSANKGVRPTQPELRLMVLIRKHSLPYKYTGDGSFWIEKINPDFVNNDGRKVVIEVFGNYWHGLESVKQRDKRKLQVLKSFGWDRIVVWERELRSGKETEIVNRIKEVS